MTHTIRAHRWFLLFALAHLLFWTAVPALVRLNLPLDSIEGTIWGHQLQWGYDKNPFLNGWLTALAVHLSSPSGWMIYLFSQLSVVLCFWAIWQLAKQMVEPVYALIAVMVLEGVQYYHFHAIDFNDNNLELSTWALTIYFFYRALRSPSTLSWLFTGIFAALGMMAKYYTITLLASMAIFLLINPNNRKQLATSAPYAGLAIFVAIILPHLFWLFAHDFITVTYVFERGSSTPHWSNHFFYPLQFAWQLFQTFLPALILYGILFLGKKPVNAIRPTLSTFDRSFLLCVGLGPFLLTVILSFFLGTKLRAGWGMPLLSTWGIILIAFIPPSLTPKKLYTFIAAVFFIMALLLTGYTISLAHSSTESSANFPGREIATTLTQKWHDTYHTPLSFVAGSRWIGGNIEFYSADHPAVFIEWEVKRAPWIDVKELQQKGALFVWEITGHENLPDAVREQFPPLLPTQVLKFNWQRDAEHKLHPIEIGIAILPPALNNQPVLPK